MEHGIQMINKTNYWLSTTEKPRFSENQLPEKVDIAIAGAGFSGLSAALTLSKAGVSTVVLESETIGWGASSRNGGMVLTGMKLGFENLVQKFGRERAREMFALSLDAIETTENIIRDENIDCSFSRCGHLEVAWKPSHFESYARSAEILEAEIGYAMRIIPREKQYTEIGSDFYYGGIVDERSAGLNPAKFVFGLAKSAEKAGARMHEHTCVESLDRQGTGFSIKTNRGTVLAENIFVGTSGYGGRAIPALQKRIIPIGSYIIATAPLSRDIAAEVSPRNRMIFDSKNFLYYFRLTPDNRMLFGGRAAFVPETISSTRDSAPVLQQGMVKVFPQLRNIPVDYVWGGSLDFAIDSMPHTGIIDGAYHSVGFAGHGVAFATHLGKLVAQNMLGKKVVNPLEGLPFPTIPFYNGTPWFLPLAGLYFKILDMIS
jgi:glycine/D-amino acid oxidase-like deaminating enzyme